jgi:DNA repair photolyase
MTAETTIRIKSALTRSRIGGVEYVINPYRGCEHGCAYCYAPLIMARAGADLAEPWGRRVEVKENLPAILESELRRRRKPPGHVLLSSICDPYQPAERRHRLTRRSIELLAARNWRIEILTRSPLVLDDLEILKEAGASVGFSIPTDKDAIRRRIEPAAPAIEKRIEALAILHEAGIETRAFIAPILPLDAERLHALLAPHIDGYMVSALNYYDLARRRFHEAGLDVVFSRSFAPQLKDRIRRAFANEMERV